MPCSHFLIMITRNENGAETRSQYLQRVCIAFLRENWEAQKCTVDYDGATRDGSCLAHDLESALMEDSPANAKDG